MIFTLMISKGKGIQVQNIGIAL